MWSKARKQTSQMWLGSSEHGRGWSMYGLAGREEGMGLQKEVGPGYESQAVSVLCSSGCGNSWRGILSREIDLLTDNSWPQSSLLLSLPLSRYIQMPSSTPSPL